MSSLATNVEAEGGPHHTQVHKSNLCAGRSLVTICWPSELGRGCGLANPHAVGSSDLRLHNLSSWEAWKFNKTEGTTSGCTGGHLTPAMFHARLSALTDRCHCTHVLTVLASSFSRMSLARSFAHSLWASILRTCNNLQADEAWLIKIGLVPISSGGYTWSCN